MDNFIGIFQGFKVKSIPDKDFKGPIIVPQCMVEYLEKAEKLREEYNNLRIEQIFSKRSKNDEQTKI
jgi:hypothetical protein